MQKRGYFITYGLSSTQANSGVALKIRNQIESFNNSGLHCEEITFPYRTGKLAQVMQRLPFTNVDAVWEFRNEFNLADFLYMRHPFMVTGAVRKVLKEIRDRNPQIKIVMELPTYPYDDEYRERKLSSILIMRDRYNRERLQGLVNYIANLEEADSIFGLPVLKISNGINVDAVPKRVPAARDLSTIHLCAVAVFSSWHGYERIIDGMDQYYRNGGTRNMVCHFAGNGPELSLYKKMVSDRQLNDHFVFHGYIEGQELDSVYNISTLALGSFGMYKSGTYLSCNLKSRESVARGIPSVTGCRTDIFVKEKFPYFLEFPNDSSFIDFQKIIGFHDEIYQNGQEPVIEKIREYAYDTVGMDATMKEVAAYFLS